MPPCGWGMPSRSTSPANRVRSSARSMVSRVSPGRSTPCRDEWRRQVERRLAAELDERGQRRIAVSGLGLDDLQDALRVQRLEVQPGRGVEVRRDCLGVRVDHHRLPAVPAERLRGLDRAVVELDALADAHRPRADDQRRRPGHRGCLGRRSRGGIRGVEVGRLRRELRGAGIDHREPRAKADGGTSFRHRLQGEPGQRRDVPIPERGTLGGHEQAVGEAGPLLRHLVGEVDQSLHLGQEPGRDARDLVQLGRLHAPPEQREQPPHARIRRCQELLEQLGPRGEAATRHGARQGSQVVVPRRVLGEEAGARLLQAPQRLVERGAEGPVDGHHLARRLHLAAQRAVGARELVEREARQLDHHVVERRLEGGDRGPGDGVGDLGQASARWRSVPPRARWDSRWPWTRAPKSG